MSIVLVGSTSGSVTLQEPAVAGTTVLDLPATSGTILTTASSGQSIPKAALPTGSVLQVVSATTSTEVTSTNSTQVSTGLTATITPTSSSSKILILASHPSCWKSGANTSNAIELYLYKNSVAISGVKTTIVGYTGVAQAGYFSTGFNYLDSPATASATTYTTYFNSYNGSSASVQKDSNISMIILMEIAA